jgi:hypothetical protein
MKESSDKLQGIPGILKRICGTGDQANEEADSTNQEIWRIRATLRAQVVNVVSVTSQAVKTTNVGVSWLAP